MLTAANRLPPRPPGHVLLGNLATFQGPIHQNLLAAQRAHGDVLRFEIGPKRIITVTHPDDVEHIVYKNWKNYSQGSGMEETKALLGDGLLTSSGELWRRQRSLAQPAFRRSRVCLFAQNDDALCQCHAGALGAAFGPLARFRRCGGNEPVDARRCGTGTVRSFPWGCGSRGHLELSASADARGRASAVRPLRRSDLDANAQQPPHGAPYRAPQRSGLQNHRRQTAGG